MRSMQSLLMCRSSLRFLACWFLASVSLRSPCRWQWGGPARGMGHVGAAELEGVGMVNQQMLLNASVPWAFLPVPSLL